MHFGLVLRPAERSKCPGYDLSEQRSDGIILRNELRPFALVAKPQRMCRGRPIFSAEAAVALEDSARVAQALQAVIAHLFADLLLDAEQLFGGQVVAAEQVA